MHLTLFYRFDTMFIRLLVSFPTNSVSLCAQIAPVSIHKMIQKIVEAVKMPARQGYNAQMEHAVQVVNLMHVLEHGM